MTKIKQLITYDPTLKIGHYIINGQKGIVSGHELNMAIVHLFKTTQDLADSLDKLLDSQKGLNFVQWQKAINKANDDLNNYNKVKVESK